MKKFIKFRKNFRKLPPEIRKAAIGMMLCVVLLLGIIVYTTISAPKTVFSIIYIIGMIILTYLSVRLIKVTGDVVIDYIDKKLVSKQSE